ELAVGGPDSRAGLERQMREKQSQEEGDEGLGERGPPPRRAHGGPPGALTRTRVSPFRSTATTRTPSSTGSLHRISPPANGLMPAPPAPSTWRESTTPSSTDTTRSRCSAWTNA